MRRHFPMLCYFGHVASYQELLEWADYQYSAVQVYRGSGVLFDADGAGSFGGGAAALLWNSPSFRTQHLREDVYVCAHLDADELAAARVGGLLDCVTILRRRGLLPDDPAGTPGAADATPPRCTHLRARRNAPRVAVRARAERARAERSGAKQVEIRVHWNDRVPGVPTRYEARNAAVAGNPVSRLEVALPEALRQALTTCLTPEQAISVIAAISPQHLSIEDTAAAIAKTPRRVRAALNSIGLPDAIATSLRARAN